MLESDSGVIFCKSAAEPRADNVVRGAARAIPEPIPGEWHYNPQLHKPWPGHRFRGKVAIAEQRDLFRCRLNDAVYDEIALYGFGHHHRSASQILVAQGPQRDDAAAAEEGQHALSLDADSYVLAFEQQVPRLGEGDPVRYGFSMINCFQALCFPSRTVA